MDLLEWLGYLASAIVLISLLMTSIMKLRWINMFGSLLFATYGFMIGSLPVAIMNLGIVVINVFFLYKIYTSKTYFHLITIDPGSDYLEAFTEFYQSDLEHYFGVTDFKLNENSLGLYILRNMIPAGIFIADRTEPDTLMVRVDYAIPEYRDFKLANYLFEQEKAFFKGHGIKQLTAHASNESHEKYLKKVGFKQGSDAIFHKDLT